MKSTSIRLLLAVIIAGAVACGCGAKKRQISDLQRKEATHHVSEAQFALSIRDYPRAESLMIKAVELVPDAGPYWVTLGSARIKQGKRDAAREAYKRALDAFEMEAKAAPTNPEPWLRQVYVLALLGRVNDARARLEKAAKTFPDHRAVRQFIEGKQIDRMLADPKFKEVAL